MEQRKRQQQCLPEQLQQTQIRRQLRRLSLLHREVRDKMSEKVNFKNININAPEEISRWGTVALGIGGLICSP